jgi:Tfp pilus assembly protein PilE
MGQQQLLLIVLGVIIVGIAIAVGISMFKSNAQSSNRDQVINDLNNLAAKAQQYYRKPTAMAGGGQSFGGFSMAAVDTSNANGRYWVTATDPGPAGTYVTIPAAMGGTVGTVGVALDSIYICGVGTEVGNNNINNTEAVTVVTQNGATTKVLN